MTEFPTLDGYAETYKNSDFLLIANSHYTGAGNEIADVKAYFQSNAIDYCHEYHGNIMSVAWAYLGYNGGIPFNVLIDRDKYVRMVDNFATGGNWNTCIQQISGSV